MMLTVKKDQVLWCTRPRYEPAGADSVAFDASETEMLFRGVDNDVCGDDQ